MFRMGLCDRSVRKPLLAVDDEKKERRKREGIYSSGTAEYELESIGRRRSENNIKFAGNEVKGQMSFSRIRLLLWKNFLFRKRHYIVSTLEVILPTLLAILLAYLRTIAPEGIEFDTNHNTTFPVVEESVSLSHASRVFSSCLSKCVIAYAPDNALTQEIMEKVKGHLPNATFDLRGFPDDSSIEIYLAQLVLDRNSTHSASDDVTIKSAVVFDSGVGSSSPFPSGHLISYKIRLVDVPELENTKDLFPWFQIPGPMQENVVNYENAGFTGLQIAIDKSIIQTLTSQQPKQTINVQAFPYPPYKQSINFNQIYFIFLPQFIVLGFIFVVPSIIRSIIAEKETGIKELMKMMGLPNWTHWVGWMINSLSVLVMSITIVTLLFFVQWSDSGAVLIYTDPFLWWIALVLYAMAATSFCFLISTFFQKPTIGTTVGIILWLVTYYAPVQSMEPKYQFLPLHTKLLSALLPNVALHWLIKVICGFEGKSVGSKWSNLFDGVSSVDELSVGLICIMLLFDIFLYSILTIYFENIIPSEFGLRKPWFYIFKPSTWGFGIDSPRVSTANFSSDFDSPGFEGAPGDLTAGVIIKDLRKRFGRNKIAVDGVSLKFYHGQITALLGHNGAGKTTTMSMLTGLFSPSSGCATVNGYDISTEMDKVRMNMGLCPQHNMLFNDLTVEEHLVFFGRLKGLSTEKARSEMKILLEKLQLAEKRKVLAASISGGQKRKLCLGMALIGGTSVVVLDEPTSGMDVEARRSVWDLLLEMRGERTIILTTHFMEEADVLGDRIAIMADGKIKCCGSPMFLKKFYGAGYTLRSTLCDPSTAYDILAIIQKYIPNASLQNSAAHAREVGITIPNESNTNSIFPALFSELSDRKTEFGIETVGLSLTTMDEVFIKVGEKDTREIKNGVETTDGCLFKQDVAYELFDGQRLKGLHLSFQQFYALIMKKIIYTFRKRKLFISQFLLPICMLIATILLSNRTFSPPSTAPPLKIELSTYKNPITLYKSTDKFLGSSFASVVGKSARESSSADMITGLLSVGLEDLGVYREKYIVGGEFNASSLTALFSSIPIHASPLAVNIISNTILKNTVGNLDYSIEVSSHPLESTLSSLLEPADPNPVFSMVVPILFGVLLPIGLALFSASYIVFPLEEKLSKAKQLQLMTGVSPFVYWVACFTLDFFLMVILISFMVLCFPAFQSHGAFTVFNGGGVIFLLLIVYGFSSISFSYLLSLFTGTIPGGFSLIVTIHILTGIILPLIVFLVESAGLPDKVLILREIGRLFPTFGASTAIMRFTSIATRNSRCNILAEDIKNMICNPRVEIHPEYRQCCSNCASFANVSCFTPESYLTWNYKSVNLLSGKLTDDERVPGIAQDLLYLFLIGIIYKIILLCLEYGIVNKIAGTLFRKTKDSFRIQTEDEDVQAEDKRVKHLVSSGRCGEDALVVNNLCKNYGSFAAVSGLSFGVHHGECFGLLGVNGAGKTTSFRMLTGDEIRSDGNAFANSYTLDKNQKNFLSLIGYCPQFDGIVSVLTGEEMLNLFARLRGIQSQFVERESQKWLRQLGLSDSGNSQCGKYSGGMKRRLSAAMALIGDPPIILLDEPTTGVDPIGRREFWKVISSVREAGQACVLTSHSMEECEALCSRLGIMVNGAFQCLGGVQHLKQKFAQGYSLVLKLRNQNLDEVNDLMEEMNTKFNPCILKDKHQNIIQYQVLNTEMSWGDIFTTMESIKSSYNSLIEDYAVSETTLEEVFLSFARKQYPNRDTEISMLRKIVTCSCCH